MVRFIRLFATLLASLAMAPGAANATVFHVSIFADMVGTQTHAACGPDQVFPYCQLDTSPYEISISRDLGYLDLLQGDNPFAYGTPYGSGYLLGTINNDNGVLTGRDLSYDQGAFCHGFCGYDYRAYAATFWVTGGVPEPETWATLLVGIGAVAWAMRRRTRRQMQPLASVA